MENQIYRVDLSDNAKLEVYVCSTNECSPYRETREIGVVVLKDGVQLDVGLDESELDSLIDYLRNCQRYIQDFNKKSLPKPDIV